MDIGFWKNLPKPFFCLAPMADVTDAAFRRLITKYSRHGQDGGGPDVFWSEFVSADGLMSPGREVLRYDLMFTEGEHPMVAQLFSSNPEKMEGAARLCQELGFDGIDINMGCPDRSIEKQKCGAAMIKNPDIAVEIIRAAKRGAPNLPISVKTRTGYNQDQIDEWVPVLLKEGIAVLSMHARTRKEMSKVPAHWEEVRRTVEIRDKMGVDTLIVGNGDVKDVKEAWMRAKETGCDGVMIGRGIFGNPWFFDSEKDEIPLKEKLKVCIEHTKLFEELLGHIKNFAIMKKHYKAYIEGFEGAKELREKLMETKSAKEVEDIIEDFLSRSV